jgi:hypothetical protein
MVTGDPYALEAMQFQTTADYCGTPNKTLFGMDSSLRYYAWELRTLLFNSVAAPASVPSWLKPQSYWQTYLDRNLAWTIPHISYGSSGVLQTRFQWATLDSDVAAQGTINTLMELYTTAVWCMAADLYPATNWVAVRDFSIRNAIARTNNTSGWNRSIPTVYGWQVAPNGSGSSATIFTTWAAMWAYNITPAAYSYGDTIGYDPAGQIIGPKVNPNYVVETNFSLSWCGQRGNTAAAACNAWAKPYCLTYTRSLLRWAV